MKKSKFNLLIYFGLFFISGAIALTLYNFYEDYTMYLNAKNVSDVLETKIIENLNTEFDDSDFVMKTEEIDGYNYIGILEISNVELKLPVMDTWDYERLKIAPTYYSGSYYDDNLVLCAHNSKAHFGKIHDIEIGDEITFTTVDDKVYKYVVSNIRVLNDTDVEEMIINSDVDDSKESWDLTLFTCTLDGKARFAARAIKVN